MELEINSPQPLQGRRGQISSSPKKLLLFSQTVPYGAQFPCGTLSQTVKGLNAETFLSVLDSHIENCIILAIKLLTKLMTCQLICKCE